MSISDDLDRQLDLTLNRNWEVEDEGIIIPQSDGVVEGKLIAPKVLPKDTMPSF